MHGIDDDLWLAALRYAPLLFVLAGIAVVVWLNRQRLPDDVQPDVLAALSDTEALPAWSIRQRPPLDTQVVDLETLTLVLERLRHLGLAVRWYEVVDVPGPDGRPRRERQAVYRRVAPRSAPSPQAQARDGGADEM